MTQSNVICASLFSGIVEVLFTHPIDHYKTYLQHKKFTKNKKLPWKWKNIYKGVNQTIIDYPIEYLKIRNITKNETIKEAIVSFSKHKHMLGVSSTLSRNIGFACIFNYITKKYINNEDNWEEKFKISAFSGFTAATMTQPFDYFKTCAQSNKNLSFPQILNNIKNPFVLFSGLWGRNLVSLISMGIGFTTFELGKCYFSL